MGREPRRGVAEEPKAPEEPKEPEASIAVAPEAPKEVEAPTAVEPPKEPEAPEEPKAPIEPPIEEEIPDTVLVLNTAGDVVRTYTREEHGDDLVALAESFAKKHGKRVQIPE